MKACEQRPRTGRALLALIGVLATTLITIEARPASAAATVSLSASTVADGGTVRVTTSGHLAASSTIALCPRAELEGLGTPTNPFDLFGLCSDLYSGSSMPTSYDATIHDINQPETSVSLFRCSALPDGCAVAAFNYGYVGDDYTVQNFAWTPLEVQRSPRQISAQPSAIGDDGLTTVTTSGLPSGPATIQKCQQPRYPNNCEVVGTYPAGIPATTQVRVPHYYMDDPLRIGGFAITCRSCVLRAMVNGQLSAETIISITPPKLVVTPDRRLTDGDVVHVTGTGFRPPTLELAQCLGTLDWAYQTSSCSTQTTVPVAADGTIDVDFPVADPPTMADGDVASPCSISVCSVRAFHGTGWVATQRISFGDPYLSVSPNEPRWDGDRLFVTVTGVGAPQGTQVTFAQCQAPLGDDLATSRCAPTRPVGSLDAVGTAYVRDYVVVGAFTDDQGTVDCRDDSCVMAAFGPNGEPLDETAFDFEEPTGITLMRTTDFVWGPGTTDTHWMVKGLAPSSEHRLTTCVRGTGSAAERCAVVPRRVFTTDAGGRASSSGSGLFGPTRQFTTASPRPRYRYCHDQCAIGVVDGSGAVIREVPISFATGRVDVTPSSGLADGSQVAVHGIDLPDNYAGPTVLFPTGKWAVVQCDAAVGSTPTIVEVFTRCALARGDANVIYPWETNQVQAAGTIDKILGGTTDCTAQPGDCVLGYARWEQDGSTSFRSVPLTFG